MKLRLFFILTVLFTIAFASNSFARKPAVEDFVGVETESYKPTTQGTEVIFNFGNHIDSHQKQKKEGQKTTSWFVSLVLLAFIALPFFMWYGITNSLNSIEETDDAVEENKDQAVEPTLNNVKHLSDYKQDSSDDDIKKAS